MDGGECFTDVVRGAARAGVDFEVVVFGRLVEDRLGVGGGQGIEKFLVGGGNAVVEFVAGSPQGVLR